MHSLREVMRDDLPERAPLFSAPLFSAPQRLGVLPTLAFWHDAERQWRILPLIAMTGAPLVWALADVVIWGGLSGLVSTGFAVVYPFLVMGLVERRVRREVRRGAQDVWLLRPGARRPRDRLLLAAWAAFSALMTALAAVQASAAVMVGSLFVTAGMVLVLVRCSQGVTR